MALDPRRKALVVRTVQKHTVNRVVRALVWAGLAPGYALVETVGRTSGRPRRVPVANGLVGDQFWVVAEHGRRADWVRNAEVHPAVRVRVRRRWRRGTAVLLPDDDPASRFGREVPKWNEPFVRAFGTDLLTVRIDLEPPG